ncbi:MAG: hypothetical protein ACYCW6_09965 [Candidatus Xenobia bacterium]
MQVNAKPLSFDQLQRVAQLVDGEQNLFKSTEPEPGATDPQDVIVLKGGDDLMKGDTPPAAIADEVEQSLKKSGVQVDQKFNVVPGVEAHADAQTIAKLKQDGYEVFSNRRRSLLPGTPSHHPPPFRADRWRGRSQVRHAEGGRPEDAGDRQGERLRLHRQGRERRRHRLRLPAPQQAAGGVGRRDRRQRPAD